MRQLAKRIYRTLPPPVQKPLENLYRRYSSRRPEPLIYRTVLFDELLILAGEGYFRDGRILEIGPRDGLDSKRLASLQPGELVMIDLPEKREGNEKWLSLISCPKKIRRGQPDVHVGRGL